MGMGGTQYIGLHASWAYVVEAEPVAQTSGHQARSSPWSHLPVRHWFPCR